MPRFAANLSMMFTEHPFLDRFGAAKAAGFDAVEYLFPYAFDAEDIGARLERHGLTQALFNLPPGDWEAGDRGLAALSGRREEFRGSVATALRYAAATRVGRVHVMAGLADRGDPGASATYRDSLAFLCDAAGAAGLDVLIEPINGRDMPGYFLNDFNYACDLIAELGRPNLKLLFDLYHRQILHGDVIRGLEAAMPIIGHVQIAAVPERHEPCSGELDDLWVLNRLDALGYTGFVGCEYHPAGETIAGLDWMAAFRAGA
jgi:hydroxypyruvate isomerase